MSMPFTRKYATATVTATHISIPIIKSGVDDFAALADWTPVAGDVKLSLDGAAESNITTLPNYVNGSWEFRFTAAELTARRVIVRIVDTAPKAVMDQWFAVETFGHENAMYLVDPTEPGFGTFEATWTGPLPSNLYTSQTLMERFASVNGIMLRVDDDESGSASAGELLALTDSIEWATDEINQYVENIYDVEDLATSRWVQRRATPLAVFFLFQRKGNPIPTSLQNLYDKIISDLMRIEEGKMQIPGLPTKSTFTPASSNLVVDYRFHQRKLRVVPQASVGPQYSGQHIDTDYWAYDYY